MKKAIKVIGIGGLIGALVLAVASNYGWMLKYNDLVEDRDWWRKEWEKEMKNRVDAEFLAKSFHYNVCDEAYREKMWREYWGIKY